MIPHRLFPVFIVAPAMLLLSAGPVLLAPAARADDPKPPRAKPAKPKVALLCGGADEDLKALRETLEKVPGIKFQADEIKFADFGRDGGLFTSFFVIDIADLATTDIGAIAKAVSSANTSKKDRCPPALFVVFRYLPDSIKTEQLRAALAGVKGVHPEKSWAGDANLWVGIDGSGQGKLADITRALHDAGVKFRDPITDIRDAP
jgi:hypothetical protein